MESREKPTATQSMKPGMWSGVSFSLSGQSRERLQSSPPKVTSVATAASRDSESPRALATKSRTSSATRWSGLSISPRWSSIWQ
jgi:hypothetical protein